VNLNKSSADELKLPTSFPTTLSNKKKYEKPYKSQNLVGWALLKNLGFS